MPAAYLKLYVKQHNAADAEAICEAVTRANMRTSASALSGHCFRVGECPLLNEKQAFRAETNGSQFYEYTP
jgi:hypothetical protein